jgi:glyoxylase-like metal-dependent hydrolase (beta-lactamase superfamily II)
MEPNLELVSGEAPIAPGVRLVPTPGHTPGHRVVVVETDDGDVVLLGDVCLHPVHLADPDLTYIGDFDKEVASATRRRILERLADDELLVSVSHFPDDFGIVTRVGDGFAWHAR